MKKFFLVSLCLNLLFGGLLFFRSGPPVSNADFSENRTIKGIEYRTDENDSRTAGFSEDLPAGKALEKPAAVIPSFSGVDHREQVSALMEEGWTKEDATTFVLGLLLEENLRQTKKSMAENVEDYWRKPEDYFWKHQTDEERQLQEAISELTGFDYGNGMMMGADFPFSPEKARAAGRIEHDYQMLENRIRRDSSGFMKKEDWEALALLEEEKQKDLDAVLTPEEQFEYRIRTSPVAVQLRHTLDLIDPTEGEFREVFRLKDELEELRPNRFQSKENPEGAKAYRTAEKEAEAEIRDLLGEERHKRYVRNQDWPYQRLVDLTKSYGLPSGQADLVYDLKEGMEDEMQNLYRKGLTHSDEEFKQLRAETAAEVRGILGEKAFEHYRSVGEGHWVLIIGE